MWNRSLEKIIYATGLALVASSAHAATSVVVPAAQAYAQYDYYLLGQGTYDANVRVDGNGSTTLTANSSQQLGGPFVSTVVNPLGFVSLRTEAGSTTDYHADGNGQLTYTVLVGGSGYSGIVPIHLLANLSAAVSGDGAHVGVADSNLYVAAGGSTYQWRAALCTSSCVGAQPSNVAVDTILNVAVGQFLSITESVAVEGINGGTGIAFADPYVSIDPTFLAQHTGLSLQFSQFVGNDPAPSGVPEPATWAMMVGGFGLVGGTMRLRRRLPALA